VRGSVAARCFPLREYKLDRTVSSLSFVVSCVVVLLVTWVRQRQATGYYGAQFLNRWGDVSPWRYKLLRSSTMWHRAVWWVCAKCIWLEGEVTRTRNVHKHVQATNAVSQSRRPQWDLVSGRRMLLKWSLDNTVSMCVCGLIEAESLKFGLLQKIHRVPWI
jgi:hypothetical protein